MENVEYIEYYVKNIKDNINKINFLFDIIKFKNKLSFQTRRKK
jgi:hypothetical protein